MFVHRFPPRGGTVDTGRVERSGVLICDSYHTGHAGRIVDLP